MFNSHVQERMYKEKMRYIGKLYSVCLKNVAGVVCFRKIKLTLKLKGKRVLKEYGILPTFHSVSFFCYSSFRIKGEITQIN